MRISGLTGSPVWRSLGAVENSGGFDMTSDQLRPGLRHTQAIMVSEAMTVPAFAGVFASFGGMPPVLATAFLVGFMEWACIEALRPHIPDHQHTLGTHVDVSHSAATPVGMTITAEVELIAIEGRRLRFRIECRDEVEIIGSGFHERAIVDGEKFLARVGRKGSREGRS
ncbi:MAG TPA: thioesterase family protein [Aliidongia sp.]|nr:thioesterase family protein [Aliidongia sp.]